MAKKKPKQEKTSKTDPRLKSFLRKAVAIISAEKGLNTESRIKLESLAEREKLPAELFDEAIHRLQTSTSSTSNLSHYEKAFIRFLDREFEKVAGGIISPRIEVEAIKLAKRKYELNATRAQQLINLRAEAAGLETISHQDAIAFADQSMVEQIGPRLTIDEELKSQLDKFGHKWGLSPEQIAAITNRQVSINIASRRRKSAKPLLSILLLVLVVTASVFVAQKNGWLSIGKNDSNANANDPTNNPDLNDPENPYRFPAEEIALLEKLQVKHPQMRPAIEMVLGENQKQRQAGYRDLTQLAFSPRNNSIDSEEAICRLFYSDLDEQAAIAVLKEIQTCLDQVAKDAFTIQDLKNAYSANKTLGRLRFHQLATQPNSSNRLMAVMELIEASVRVPRNESTIFKDYVKQSESQIAGRQWNRLMQTAWTTPGQAAVTLQPLFGLTRDRVNEEVLLAFRDDTLVAILETDSSQFFTLKDQVLASIGTCNESKLLDWLVIFESANEEFQSSVAQTLADRLDIQTMSNIQRDVVNSIHEFALRSRNRVLSPVIARNELLEELFEEAIKLDSNRSTQLLPNQIAQVALAINVEWAFCAAIEKTTHISDSSFVEFDRLVTFPTPFLRDLVSLSIDRKNPGRTTGQTATASDRRRLQEAIKRLNDSDPGASSLRILAMKQLNQIAHRFENIKYTDAKAIATLMHSDLSREELLNLEQVTDSFAHWPNLALAFSDQLPTSQAGMDQVLTIARLLLNRDFNLATSENWKSNFQRKLLINIQRNLEAQVAMDPNNVSSDWLRLRIYLMEIYQERLALSRTVNSSDQFNAPHLAIAELIETIANDPSDGNNTNAEQQKRLSRAIELMNLSPANEIEKIAFANQLLLETIKGSSVDLRDPALMILNDLQNRLKSQPTVGVRLFETELALLKIIKAKRKRLVNQLLNKEAQ